MRVVMEMSMTLKKESEGEAENDVTAKSQASAALMASGTHSFLTAMLGESLPGVKAHVFYPVPSHLLHSLLQYKSKPYRASEYFRTSTTWPDWTQSHSGGIMPWHV